MANELIPDTEKIYSGCGRSMLRFKSSYHNFSGNQRYIYGWECDCGNEYTDEELEITFLKEEVNNLRLELIGKTAND